MTRIDDADEFTLVVPTFNGTRYLLRCLDYLQHIRFAGRIALSDNSAGEHLAFVEACPARYPALWIDVFRYPASTRFLPKLIDTLDRIGSHAVMLCAHDDFVVPSAIERLLTILAQNPRLSLVRGRVAMFVLDRAKADSPAGEVSISLAQHPMRGYMQEDPVERVLDHLRNYSAAFYSVHRRENLAEAFRATDRATRNVIFFQYLSSAIGAAQGTIECVDELFYVRQGHADSWSATLKRSGDIEHWPLLIANPDYSRYYQEFRSALADFLVAQHGIDPAPLGALIDAASVGLIRRGLCGIEIDNPGEVAFQQRLRDPATPDGTGLRRIVEFANRYPDTY